MRSILAVLATALLMACAAPSPRDETGGQPATKDCTMPAPTGSRVPRPRSGCKSSLE